MKYKILSILLILLPFYASGQQGEKSNLALISNHVPTDTALIFGQGIISTESFEFTITFSPEMDELFFTRRKPEQDNKIYTMKLVDGKWSEPALAFFTTDTGWDFEPHISPKGELLYFGSKRPLNDTTETSGLHQWYCEKAESGWSEPIPLRSPFIEKSVIMYLTSSENGNLYFTTGEKGEKPENWGIYNAINEDGEYHSINRMGTEINFSGKWIAHSYIAPDESYMIYDAEKDSGFGDCDLYISFKENGIWTEAQNLGPKVNTEQCEMTASVSPDGKYLFFHRGVYSEEEGDIGNIYWIEFTQLKKELMGE